MQGVIQKLLAATFLAAMLAMFGCAGSSTKESSGQYVDDAAITTKVKAKFVEDKTVSAMRIHVETVQGVVQLTGEAATLEERAHAAEVARAVSGVKDVKNDIQLKSS